MLIVVLFTISKTWKQPKCPSADKWIKWYIHTVAYSSAVKKNEIMPFTAKWMQIEIIILSEVSQKEKKIPHAITFMQTLKYGTNEPVYKRETDS